MSRSIDDTIVHLHTVHALNLHDVDDFVGAVDRETGMAFQPLVHIDTGIAHGYEALLRGVELLGMSSIGALFDHAHAHGWLGPLERVLRRKAIRAFVGLPSPTTRLFLNTDARLLAVGAGLADEILADLDDLGLDPGRLCLEIPESQEAVAGDNSFEVFRRLRESGVHLALDDFGQGYSRMRLLHEQQPDYVKIDRYFITGIASAPKKRLFVSRIVDMMHVLGISMVAEGVETEAEFRACKDLGFDMVQGFLIQRPTVDYVTIQSIYHEVEALNARERRNRSDDTSLVRKHIEQLPALSADLGMIEVFDAFRLHRSTTLFPVVEANGRPIGVIRDIDLKTYAYAPHGRDPMDAKSRQTTLRDLARPCPTSAIDAPIEKILELFSHNTDAPGVMLVENGRYSGFMDAIAILTAMHEKNLNAARDRHPLTRLPGNLSITDWVADAVKDTVSGRVLVYFDFDAFKPFNDSYGFRQGDRAIQLFAELLQKEFHLSEAFLGHIGGDDFFAGFMVDDVEAIRPRLVRVVERFSREAESFYDAKTRDRGHVVARGRDGMRRRFGLLGCRVGIVVLPAGRSPISIDRIKIEVARLKQHARDSEHGLAEVQLL
ncbi:MAG: GGDEF domain-containing protein [Alphaproteobacteria bacterium]|nr:GGDEF domain-containing protein [Alphaproteobacteria bacterium]